MSPPTRSAIWNYFTPDQYDRESAKCKICNRKYSRKGRTTTSLKSHLKSMHPKYFSLFQSSDKENKEVKASNEKKERMDAGEKTAKFNECDKIIFSIIDKDASRDGVDVSQNSEHSTLSGTNLDNTLSAETPKFVRTKASILQHMTSMDDVCELVQLKKRKAEAEIELIKEKVEIARREKYKLDLELVKMEKDLGIAQLSSFTAPYSPY